MMQQFSKTSMRLWQLISPTLPIGAYSYSQALEYAVEAGWVDDENTATEWIHGQIKNNLAMLDVPIFFRLYEAWQNNDLQSVNYWNAMILSMREAAELRMEDANLGHALARVLSGLQVELPELESEENAFVTLFSFACQRWQINRQEAAHGLLWSWCENQVAAAIKLIPLGQTSGQRIMSQAMEVISSAYATALSCKDEDIGLLTSGLAIASALHETQYSRLFRS